MTRRVHKGGTYYDFAASEAGGVGGRYGAISKTQVTGTGSVSQYPSQPPGSPWHDEPCGLEPPFPIDIGPAAVVGETFEIEQSLAALDETGDGGGMNSNQPSQVSPSGGDVQHSSPLLESSAPSPLLKRKRRK